VFGDGDPVDVVEISSTTLEMGGVYQVKCVGAYAMIDDGELDWKVIAINTADPLADKINDVEDVERYGTVDAGTCSCLTSIRSIVAKPLSLVTVCCDGLLSQ
jgi:inorganic pyrophosphatase